MENKIFYEIGVDEAGEKWNRVKNDGHHSLQGCQLFCLKIATTCTGHVMTHFARPCQFVCEYLEQTSDKVYCSCKEGVRKYV